MFKDPSAKYSILNEQDDTVLNPLVNKEDVLESVEVGKFKEEEGGGVGQAKNKTESEGTVQLSRGGRNRYVVRSVDLNMFEKVWMLLEFSQLYSLLLVASFQYWPPRYLKVMKYFAFVANLDFVLGKQDIFSEWIGFEGYFKSYAMLLCMAPVLLYVSYRLFESRFKLGRRLFFMNWRAAMVLFMDFLLLPLLLNFSRMFQCVEVSDIKSVTWTIEYEVYQGMLVDHEVECAGVKYWLGVTVLGMTCFGMVAFLLTFYRQSTVNGTTYRSQIDHSKMLVRYELEWMLGLGEDWLWGGMWSLSSWNWRGRWWRVIWVLQRILYAGGFLFLYDRRPLLGALMWTLAIANLLHTILLRPYRLQSSNVCKGVLDFIYVFNCSMLVLNVQEMRSAYTLPNRQIWILGVYNATGFAAFLGAAIWFKTLGEAWPSFAVLEKLSGYEKFEKWTNVVRDANRVLGMCAVGSRKVAPLDFLEVEMRRVRNCYLQALKERSVFGIILNATLEAMASTHDQLRGESLLPGRELADTLRGTGDSFEKRRYYQSLMSPQKRRILLKLLAVKMLIGNRNIEKLWDWETKLVEDGEVLMKDTEDLLGESVESEFAFTEDFTAALEDLGKKWKHLIKNWEKMYKLFNCVPPGKEEKRGRLVWYKSYKVCGRAAENLRRGWPFLGLGVDFGEKVDKALVEGGGLLMECWLPDSLGRLDSTEVELKARLKEFESAWEESFGRSLTLKEKKEREEWYRMYRELKKGRDLLRKWERQGEKLVKKWNDGGLDSCCVYSSDGRVTELCSEIGAEWKALIKGWIDEYKSRTGKDDVSSDDKRGRKVWYEKYSESRTKIKEIEAGIKSLEKLEKKTEKLLRRGGGRSDLLKAKTAWKGHIKKWENQFVIENGAKATSDDKEMIEEWYLTYKQVGEKLVDLEAEMLREQEWGGDDDLAGLDF